jgi:hypothetical protein
MENEVIDATAQQTTQDLKTSQEDFAVKENSKQSAGVKQDFDKCPDAKDPYNKEMPEEDGFEDDKEVVKEENDKQNERKAIEQKESLIKDASAEDEKIKPLEFWEETDKEFFNSLDAKAQKNVLGLFEKTDYVYRNIIKKAQDKAKNYADLDNLYEENKQAFKDSNIDKTGYVKNLIERDKRIHTDPVGFVLELMDKKGVTEEDLQRGFQNQDAKRQVLEELKPTNEKIKSIEAKLQDKEDKEQIAYIYDEFRSFCNEKNQDGTKKYEYLHDVGHDLIEAVRRTGRTDFKDMYEELVWTNPVLRQKEISKAVGEKNTQSKTETYEQKIKNAKEAKLGKSYIDLKNTNADHDYKDALELGEDLKRRFGLA